MIGQWEMFNDSISCISLLDNNYIILEKLGDGQSSNVYLALCRKKNILSAIKIYKNKFMTIKHKQVNTNDNYFVKENNTLNKLSHDNIIKKLNSKNNACYNKNDGCEEVVNYISLEYAENGCLINYLMNPNKGLGEYMSKHVFSQLVDALSYIHQQNFIHLDIKLDNILLDKYWNVKLADFGYAIQNEYNKLISSYVGTLCYCAPEILKKNPFLGYSADIFSLGVVLFILVVGSIPFKEASAYDESYKLIIKGEFDLFWKSKQKYISFNLSSEFKSIFFSMVCNNPSDRINMNNIKENIWLKGKLPSIEEISEEFNGRKKLIRDKR